MYIMDDGIRLNAKLEMPESHGDRLPLVILSHGFTGHMEERHIVAVAQAIRAAGFAVLRVELYGHGHSDGEFRNHTLYKWLNNLLAVVDYARGLDWVSELYLCGHSQGGLAVMLTAAMEGERIAGVIPMSPATMIPEGARRGELLGRSFDPEHIPDEIPSWDGNDLDGNYVRVAQTIDVNAAIDRYRGPVLLIHGDADEAVPFECGVDAAKRYANCEFVRIPGDTHCYDNHLDEVTNVIEAWLKGRRG